MEIPVQERQEKKKNCLSSYAEMLQPLTFLISDYTIMCNLGLYWPYLTSASQSVCVLLHADLLPSWILETGTAACLRGSVKKTWAVGVQGFNKWFRKQFYRVESSSVWQVDWFSISADRHCDDIAPSVVTFNDLLPQLTSLSFFLRQGWDLPFLYGLWNQQCELVSLCLLLVIFCDDWAHL